MNGHHGRRIATEDNLAELRKRGYHWITVKRGGVKPDQIETMKTLDAEKIGPDQGMRCGPGNCPKTMRTRRNCASGARPVGKG